jgi:perosamine synthetase
MAIEQIPVCEPYLAGNEEKYVLESVRSGWISSSGKHVHQFEEAFAKFCGAKYAVSASNGTAALHLALLVCGISAGDEVIIPSFTMIATAFAVCYCGAKPVFVDAELDTWNIDPTKIESKISKRTKAIIAVSIFGHPCEMDALNEIAQRYNLSLIEDAAESHGAEYKGKRTGTLAKISAFSFFANKIITTGEGGMVVTDDPELSERARYFKNLCFPLSGPRSYLHSDIGFNYRLSNLQAALGLAQVEKAEFYANERIVHAAQYTRRLSKIEGIILQKTKNNVKHVHWMNGIIVDTGLYGKSRDQLMEFLREKGIETRLLFMGMHRQPALIKYGCDVDGSFNVTDYLSHNGLYLPSGTNLAIQQIDYVCDMIVDFSKK